MAKNTKGKAVAKTVKGGAVAAGVPAHLANVEMTGAGADMDQNDLIVPMARILQKNSPEVEKRGTNYIPGAEPGDTYLKTANQIIKADDPFIFQPCYRSKGVVEWLPRNKGGGGGGGFVMLHPFENESEVKSAKQKPHPEDDQKKIWVRGDNGNLLVSTRYFGGFRIIEDEAPQAMMIPFSSSGHTVAKAWNMMISRKFIRPGVKADLFSVYYKLTSVLKTKGPNTWWLYEVTDAGEEDGDTGLATTMWCPTTEDYERGKALYESLQSGARQFNAGDALDHGDDNEKM